ncbi:MAG: hypothetical protein JSR80_06600 [Verrucomicrobia bacterium]|nr:hypothetical protein [Verrucomicrobiota bacterium]
MSWTASWTLGSMGTCLVVLGGIGVASFIHGRFGKVAKQLTSKEMVVGVAFSAGVVATGLLSRQVATWLDPSKEEPPSSPKKEFKMFGNFKDSGMSHLEFIEAVKNTSKLIFLDVEGFLESLKEEEKQERIHQLIQAIAGCPDILFLTLRSDKDQAVFLNMQVVKEALPDESSEQYKKYYSLTRPYLEASWFEGKKPQEIAVEILERCCEESDLSIHPNFVPKLEQAIQAIEEPSKRLPQEESRTERLPPPAFPKPSMKGRRALEVGAIVSGILLMAAAFYLDKQKRSKGVVTASILGSQTLLVGGVFSWRISLPKSTSLERLVQYLPAIDPDDAAKIETLYVRSLALDLRIADTWKRKKGEQYLEDLLLVIRSCPNLKVVHLDDVFDLAKGVPTDKVVRKVVDALDNSSVTSVFVSGSQGESVFLNPSEMKGILNDEALFKRYSKLLHTFEASWHEETPPLELALQMFKGLKHGKICVKQQPKLPAQEKIIIFGAKVKTWSEGDKVSLSQEEQAVAIYMTRLLERQLKRAKSGESLTLQLKPPEKDLNPKLRQAIEALKN